MKTLITIIIFSIAVNQVTAQVAYTNSLKAFRTKYINTHEVVKGKDKQYFRFFAIDSAYRVNARFERIHDTIGFTMKTSAGTTQHYFKYGKAVFDLKGNTHQLFIYQSKALIYTSYKEYLFIPFTDSTTGDQSYGSGRYIDLLIPEIKNNSVTIDFNKAYNPYCAYATGFHCPLPPKENSLSIAIIAGEKVYGKPIH
ncbi:MAG: DUF1684 domain-containing protein [Ferruginibacter sp.]